MLRYRYQCVLDLREDVTAQGSPKIVLRRKADNVLRITSNWILLVYEILGIFGKCRNRSTPTHGRTSCSKLHSGILLGAGQLEHHQIDLVKDNRSLSGFLILGFKSVGFTPRWSASTNRDLAYGLTSAWQCECPHYLSN